MAIKGEVDAEALHDYILERFDVEYVNLLLSAKQYYEPKGRRFHEVSELNVVVEGGRG